MTITDQSELQKGGQCQLGTRSQGGGDIITKGPLKPDPEAEPRAAGTLGAVKFETLIRMVLISRALLHGIRIRENESGGG